MKRALIFPGQGSQYVGMGKELAAAFAVAKERFQEIDETLKQNLSRLMFDGPFEELSLTANTQPALMAVSLAVMRVLEKEGGKKAEDLGALVAGHSLGEYSALAAVRAITLSDTAKLLKIRGTAMQEAVPRGWGGMAAILGVDFAKAKQIAEAAAKGDVCQAANDNSPEQVVISGTVAAIGRAMEIAPTYGAKRVVTLPVSAPFHSALMAPAARVMEKALAETAVNLPAIPLVANVTAEKVTDPETIRELLVKQVTDTVRWRETILLFEKEGIEMTVEIGAGKVLSGLTKRCSKQIQAISIETPRDIEAFLESIA